jgi:hypothetical protein
MQTGANNMHLRLKVSLILIATTLQNHTYVGDNTNSAKMFLTGLQNRTFKLLIPNLEGIKSFNLAISNLALLISCMEFEKICV